MNERVEQTTDHRLLESVGRSALAAVFVLSGIEAFRAPDAKARPVEDAGVAEQEAEALVRINGAAMAAGGASLALGIFSRLAAVGLVASLGATTAVAHRFWDVDDPEKRAAQRTQFLKNLGLAGGLLLYLSKPRGARHS